MVQTKETNLKRADDENETKSQTTGAHVKVLRYARVAVSAQNVRLRGNTLVCIRESLGEDGDGLAAEVLETHTHVGHISPRITDGAELPIENRKRTASIGKASKLWLLGRGGSLPVCHRDAAARSTPYDVVNAEVSVHNTHRGIADTGSCFTPGNEEIVKLAHLRHGCVGCAEYCSLKLLRPSFYLAAQEGCRGTKVCKTCNIVKP